MNQYFQTLQKTFTFSGRARRTECLIFALVNTAIDLVGSFFISNQIVFIAAVIWFIGLFIANLALGTRRLHDTGRSGWFILIGLIPCIGVIILIVFYAEEGKSGSNQYGTDPKAGERDSLAG